MGWFVCNFEHRKDFLLTTLRVESRAWEMLNKIFGQQGRIWVFNNPRVNMSKMLPTCEPDDLLTFLMKNFYISIMTSNWSIYKKNDKSYEFRLQDEVVKAVDCTEAILEIIETSKSVTNIEVNICTKPENNAHYVYGAAQKKLKEASFHAISEELLRLHIEVTGETAVIGDEPIDRFLNQLKLIGQFVQLTNNVAA